MVYACHCTDCQKRSGSAFGLSVWVPRAAIEVTKGSPEARTTTSEGGRMQYIQQCGQCYTRLWTEPKTLPSVGIVRGGTLDDTSWLQPVAHIWTRSAQPWFVFPEGVRRYEVQPSSMDQIAELWREYRARLDG